MRSFAMVLVAGSFGAPTHTLLMLGVQTSVLRLFSKHGSHRVLSPTA